MDQSTQNLGTLKGKVLIFGGVYSNLQALDALISVAEKENIPPENCICTGDIVGYCAQPNDSVLRLKDWRANIILGNVEIQINDNANDCGCDFKAGSRCDDFSKNWYPFAKSQLDTKALEFIKSLPHHIKFKYAGKQVFVLHGSFFNVSEFIFKSTAWSVKQANFEATQSDTIVAGHSGLPFKQSKGNKTWINPGVIGMPANDGLQSVWYAILNDEQNKLSFEHHKLDYNFKLTHDLMIQNKLPNAYAETILSGIWDNTEILPTEETKQQGFEIDV